MKRILLLSIRPRFASMILDGTKTVELRRTRPGVAAGDILLIYVSSPAKHIAGYSFIDSVVLGSPRQVWSAVKAEAGLSWSEYRRYFTGVDTAYAIRLRRARSLPRPIALEAIRKAWPGFVPPQVYRYVNPSDPLWLANNSLKLTRRAGP
jgi:predicted transcriptional regulator